MERMAAGQTPGREGDAVHEAVLDEREPRILRTGRREATTAWQERRDQPLIGRNDSEREPRRAAHDRAPGIVASAARSSPAKVANGCRSAAGRPMITRAACVGAASRIARYASRRRR